MKRDPPTATAGAISPPTSIAKRVRAFAGRRRYPLHVNISFVFVALILVWGMVIGLHNYGQSSKLILAASGDLFERIAREAKSEVDRAYAPIAAVVDLFSHQRIVFANTLDARLESLPYIREAIRQSEALSALYVGYEDGDFFLARPLARSPELREKFDAPAGAFLMVQSVEREPNGETRGSVLFFDAEMKLLLRREQPEYAFDPRSREWYRDARGRSGQTRTAPYVFFTTREVGTTLARRTGDANGVVGADLTLTALSDVLRRQKISPSAQIVMFDSAGRAIAYTDAGALLRQKAGEDSVRLATVAELGAPALEALMQRFRAGETDRSLRLEIAGREWTGLVSRLDVKGDQDLYLGVVAPNDELLAHAARIRNEGALITLAILLLTVPVAWLLSRTISKPLRQLSEDAKAIQQFQFDKAAEVDSFVVEINDLARGIDEMRATIRKFLELSSALAAERNLDHLLERVVGESLALAHADAAAVYLVDDDGLTLTLAHYTCPGVDRPVGEALAPLRLEEDAANEVAAAAREGRTRVVSLASGDPGARYFTSVFELLGAQRLGVAAVPLHNRQREVVGVLVFARKLHAAWEGEAFSAGLIPFVEALSGTAAVSIEARRLLKAQKDLLDAFIQLIAGTIDAKSPYTGGHCQRVPELTFMLARAACDAKDGPYRDFDLSEDEWEAVHIASWLHDCGKVTTPEYVVDKATKLETLYDRIHEVRMRFEVLKRDAEIEHWKSVAAGGDAAALGAKLDARRRELDADFAFVAECNVGGEFMAPDRIERLKTIAAHTWQRTLDDRLGVSWEERNRMEHTPAQPLPATERLLSDKPEHVLERGAQDIMPPDNPWGFRLDVPAAKFNRGEIHNLSVGRGTLTEEERFKINDHIVQTIVMLSRLPFPKHLRGIPEIAGGHHEKMDGTGYPKRLKREEMSPIARMMAIADIFEALTAADRPYKQAKRLSEAIKIMSFMKKDSHIDPELFDLFLTSGVYRRYAERFLSPGQIDEVDVRAYV